MKNRNHKEGPIGYDRAGNLHILPVAPPPAAFFGADESIDAPFIEVPQTRRLLPSASADRKKYPITTGFVDYFPDAMAAVAEVSFIGNQKHNPGQPLHWSRDTSNDHADCVGRHLQERGTWDTSGPVRVRHSAQLAWRAMALLQEELEEEAGLALSRGSTPS